MPTNQETFDTVARHLLTQAEKAIQTGTLGECAYRGDRGLRCAVGCLLPDNLYDPDMEGQSCFNGSDVGAIMQRLGHDPDFLELLQDIHDSLSVAAWPNELRDLAARKELSAVVVDDLAPAFWEKLAQ